ncbi:hypothetical protein [Haloarcula sediminis]|uniref:hypothetical protein n=1 Tax=Haloarcula sediminis TaxID=3111777 RepID=UPI002D7A2BBA|nr:hypothetical protein [Haloarcula sp. CK38]
MADISGRIAGALDDVDRFVLAHHPSCAYYAHHTFELRGTELCMGCFIVYPVGLAALLVLSLLHLTVPAVATLDVAAFYAVGAAAIAPMVGYKLLYRRGSRLLYELIYRTSEHTLRVVTKVALAAGLACLVYPVVFRPAVRLPALGVFLAMLVPYVAYKGLTALDECENCPEQPEFPNCSGMDLNG